MTQRQVQLREGNQSRLGQVRRLTNFSANSNTTVAPMLTTRAAKASPLVIHEARLIVPWGSMGVYGPDGNRGANGPSRRAAGCGRRADGGTLTGSLWQPIHHLL